MNTVKVKNSQNDVENLEHVEPEIWKDIEGTDGRYQVSSYGRVRSWCNCNEGKREKPRILKQAIRKDTGYPLVSIWYNGKHNTLSVHRLVAEAFIPNPENKKDVNHKDFDRTNNHVDNLEWVSRAENIRHSMDAGRMDLSGIVDRKGEDHGMSKLTEQAVRDIRKQAEERGRYYGQKELAEKYDVSKGTIKEVVNGRAWKHVD